MPVNIRFEAILPRRKRYPADLIEKMEDEVGLALIVPIQLTLVSAMRKRVRGWSTFVQFRGAYRRRQRAGGWTGASLTVSPYGRGRKQWQFVSSGVRGHMIYRRRAVYLVIRGGRGGYRPHTSPGGGYGGPGTYNSAGTYRTIHPVRWPGIQARNFERHIVDEVRTSVVKDLVKAINRALK